MTIGSTGAIMGEQYYEENGMNGAGMATAIGNLLEILTTDSDVNDAKIPVDVAATAFLGWFANVIIQKNLPCDLEFFKLSLYQGTLDMMENTVAGITNSAYMNIKELWKCEKKD